MSTERRASPSQRRTRRGPGRAANWALLVAAELAVLALIVEGGVRLARPFVPALNSLLYSPTTRTNFDDIDSLPELLSTSMLGYIPRQNRCGFVLNSKGFRDREYRTEKAPGSYRVVIIGDSFAFSSGCAPWSKMWPTQLGAKLDDELAPPVEVINLGVAGAGPLYELRVWELEGFRLRPDVVLFAFFVGNDFVERDVEIRARDDRDTLHWSDAARLVRNLWRIYQETRGGETEEAIVLDDDLTYETGGYELPDFEYDPMKPTFSEDRFLSIQGRRMRLVLRSPEARATFEQQLDQVTATMTRFEQQVERAGAELVVLLIPDEFQVDAELRERLLDAAELDDGDVDVERPQRELTAFLDDAGIPYLDLLPSFRERALSEKLYRLQDTHWNVVGNTLAADELVAAWSELATIPKP